LASGGKARPETPPGPARPVWTDVLASIEDGVVVIDAAGCVADLNPAAEELVGVSAQHAVGLPVAAMFTHDRGGPGLRGSECGAFLWPAELVQGTIHEGVARRRAEGLVASRGGTLEVSAACAPVHDANGGLAGAVLVLRDLTLQRTLEATGRRVERLSALGTVALGLAHEIRNPLGGIKGAAQLLRGALTDPGQVRCTDIIIREVERLDGLVEQLRELTTPPTLKLEAVNIHRVLNDVLALQRQTPVWQSIAVRAEFDPSLPPVRGDRAALVQVFLNLVKNAVEAMGGAGQLVVSTRIETRFHIRRVHGRGHFLSVAIEDGGPGISEEDQARLFSPFFTTKTTGTGLGLALCHRIVAEHGGTIGYEPGTRGGARFRVTLPVGEDDVGDGGR